MFQAIVCRLSYDSGMSQQNAFEPKHPFHGNASYSREIIGILTYTKYVLAIGEVRGDSASVAIQRGNCFFSC